MGSDMIEFSDKPSVLVFADGKAATARACRSAELAGCRVSAVTSIEAAIDRLARQAGVDAVLVEIEEDGGDALDRLLDMLDEAAGKSGHGSVVSAPVHLLDLVAARAGHNRIVHLCGADEAERVAAVALASARPSLCIAAAVPPTTALRWIKMLTDVGLLVRVADPHDGRRVYIELAPQTAAGLAAYIKAAQRISPLLV